MIITAGQLSYTLLAVYVDYQSGHWSLRHYVDAAAVLIRPATCHWLADKATYDMPLAFRPLLLRYAAIIAFATCQDTLFITTPLIAYC